MKEIGRPALVLLIITAVAAMLLGIVSETTKEAIAAQSAKTEAEAMAAVMPDEGVEFEAILDVANGDTIEGTIKKVAKAKKMTRNLSISSQILGPSDWIRTSGLLNPIQARYQTSPHPDGPYD